MIAVPAKLFMNGRSQAVRLPKEFRFAGTEVTVRKMGRGVLIEPKFGNVREWMAELERLRVAAGDDDFTEHVRAGRK